MIEIFDSQSRFSMSRFHSRLQSQHVRQIRSEGFGDGLDTVGAGSRSEIQKCMRCELLFCESWYRVLGSEKCIILMERESHDTYM